MITINYIKFLCSVEKKDIAGMIVKSRNMRTLFLTKLTKKTRQGITCACGGQTAENAAIGC